MERIDRSLEEVRERYLDPTPGRKISDPKELEYRDRIKKHGYAPNPDCWHCHGAGYVHPIDENGKPMWNKVVPCEARGCLMDSKRAFLGSDSYLKHQGVSTKAQTFENFKHIDQAMSSFEAFYLVAKSLRPPFLLCYGNVGSGKTHLCQAAARLLNSKGVECRYYTVSGLLSTLKQSIAEDQTEMLVKVLSTSPALILDDWGVEYGTDWELSKLEDIIDTRYTNELITIVTSNKDITQLREMSRRITSRFEDTELSRLVVNEAPDYRPGKGKKK